MAKIHQEITFDAPPSKVYRALLDAEEHARFTGAPADISAAEGGSFSCYGGRVLGRHIELVPNALIVQAWRPATWPRGVYSIARLELVAERGKTRLVLDHDGVPEDMVEHIEGGWPRMYWEPLRKYLEE